MKAVIQRVSGAVLRVDSREISRIGKGLCVYLGVAKGDGERAADAFAAKVSKLRIFEDEAGKMNLSALNLGYEALVISNFTLCAETAQGNRPSYCNAEEPDRADELYLRFAKKLEEAGLTVKTGVFGADMQIEQTNDGPVTIVLETKI